MRYPLPSPPPGVGLGLGVATVVLIHDPRALIPRPPYWPWVMILLAVALFGLVLQLGLEDPWDDPDEGTQSRQRVVRWRAVAFAYALGVLAAVTYLASIWLISRLDRAAV